MRDERKDITRANETLLWGGLGLMSLHFYVELFTFFDNLGFTHPLATKLIGQLVSSSKFQGSHWMLKTIGGVCIILFSLSGRGVKSMSLSKRSVAISIAIGLALYAGSLPMLTSPWFLKAMDVNTLSLVYIGITVAGLLYLIKGVQGISRLLNFTPGSDEFNSENETFLQEERKIENQYSVNLQTKYIYKGKERSGWINLANPFRGNLVMGTPGSGKSYAVINSIIRQHIAKGFSLYVYDWKFPGLSLITFNAMLRHRKNLPANLKFYCLNFDNPRKSHRCNPLDPVYLPTSADAYESAKLLMKNINKKWIGTEGDDFWAKSAYNYTAALIWFLRCYQGGKYCTFPHLVEMMTIDYRKIFPILMTKPDLESYMTLFVSSYVGGAMEQLEGQIGSARAGLAMLSSPDIYWTMSANDFTLDINNPKAPKILCIANNSRKQEIYGAAMGLFNARVLNEINIPHQRPCSVIIDELPTVFFPGLGDLIATGRDNKIAVTLAMQDFSQLEDAYGKTPAEVIRNTTGTVISGAVSGQTAKAMEDRLGKNVQRKQSINIQTEDTSHGITTELQPMAPAAKIGQLDPGNIVGVVAGAWGQKSKLKAFNAEVVIDVADFEAEQKVKELPDFFTFAQPGTTVDDQVQENYYRIKAETKKIVEDELTRLGTTVEQLNKKPTKRNGTGGRN